MDQKEISSSYFPADPALGPMLTKSTIDEFDYAIGLKNGSVIRFAGATRSSASPDWISLRGVTWMTGIKNFDDDDENICSFERGIDVRVSEIAWCIDAPRGS